jgi:hypothetical protein
MRLHRGLIATSVFVITLFVLYFSLRNTLLQSVFSRIKDRFYQSYGVRLSTASLRFSGFDCILFKQFVLQPDKADTLLQFNELECNVSFTELLSGTIGFDEIKGSGANLNLINHGERNNLRFLAKINTKIYKQTYFAGINFRDQKSISSKFLHVLQTAFYLKDISITYSDTVTETLFLSHAEYDRNTFSALLINVSTADSIEFYGKVLQEDKSYHLTIQRVAKSNTYLPFFNREGGLKCTFESASATISLMRNNDEIQISTDCEARNLQLNHWRLAKEDVGFTNPRFSGICKIGNEVIELDSSSTFYLQGVPFKMYAKYSTVQGKSLSLNIQMPEIDSDSFFNALPKGMFGTLKGISCTGKLAYQMKFFLDTQQPDSLTFFSSLTGKNFHLNRFGAENYARINGPFVYEAYDKDRFVRKILVSPENYAFTPLNGMGDYLIKAVLQSEDPSFMQHRGFLPEAFRESIVKNYKQKRFARGGSTISMQLVKNVFLNRDKTISRKVEEALIVSLIENLRLVSKERMLEVYLNVIEWGPNVYGIGEASRFYFNKQPKDLTLQESVFLAGIIPAPKHFRYQFDKQGKLKPSLGGYFRILSTRMASKGWISSADTIGLRDLRLRGPALNLILPQDSVEIDTEDL